jgi:cysteinyl-tRNA synthetase
MAQGFRLYNTLSRTVEQFEPLEPGRVGLYVCGMTVYDEAHIGHARAMVVFDVVQRYLRHRGWQVDFVRNFTDVDDKIIDRAAKTGEEPIELAERYIKAFHRDATALGLDTPTHQPRVSNCIGDVIELIELLVSRDHAYEQGGSVYFSVASDADYGKLSHQNVAELRGGEAHDKRDAADFALWKAQKPGEPAWPSPWGPGRPGWHIECSAMCRKYLGDTVDIHGGGLDLVFPHHENEVAQSECATGKQYVRYWMHNGLLTMSSGKKMGKSLGNVVNISDLLQLFPAEAIRLYYMQNHYRSPLPWNEEAMPEALAMLARLYEARELAEAMGGQEDPDVLAATFGGDAKKVLELGRSIDERFYQAMDDDFNTALVLGHACELARAINRFASHKKARKRGGPLMVPALAMFAKLGHVFGILAMDVEAFQEEVKTKRLAASGLTRDEVEGLIEQRIAARAAKDWQQADVLRQELAQRNIVVMDQAQGCCWRVKL